MSKITTHVLDTSAENPLREFLCYSRCATGKGQWQELGRGVTDSDGRNRSLLASGSAPLPGRYRLSFDLEKYFQARGTFFPEASLVFDIKDPSQHYHVPLLVSGYGFSTYRGS